MGRKPELRFAFIQEHARFVEAELWMCEAGRRRLRSRGPLPAVPRCPIFGVRPLPAPVSVRP